MINLHIHAATAQYNVNHVTAQDMTNVSPAIIHSH